MAPYAPITQAMASPLPDTPVTPDSAILTEAVDGGLIAPDVAPMMRVLVERAMTAVRGDGSVLEVEDGDTLLYVAAAGRTVPSLGARVSLASSLSGLSVQLAEALWCDDSEEDPRVDLEACRRVGVRSMLCVPVALGRDVRAVLKVSAAEPHWFDAAAIERVRLLVEMIEAACDSARERTEALIAARERLEELGRMKDEFISVVNHELQTPITRINGYLDLLAEEEELTPEQARYVEIARRNSTRLAEMVDQLLTLFRADAGRLEFSGGPVDLVDVAREAVEAVGPVASHGGVAVDLEAAGSGWVTGRRQPLTQIVDNLVANAVKYTPAGGTVSVSVGTDDDRRVRLSVTDTGIGIPADELPRVFDRFYRASSATDRHIRGTGLGLAVTKALVEGLGGSIEAHSELGAGTRFDVLLPMGDA